jgi:glyoxylase-like metal-dependent hydrolase (beta-lactamase superfamily II)
LNRRSIRVRVYFHYCLPGFSNCYCIAPNSTQERCRETLLIDPGSMDEELLTIIERNNFKLAGILITHNHKRHIRGLKTLLKIYPVTVYMVKPLPELESAVTLHDGEELDIGPFKVQTLFIPGHSADSTAYYIENLLFTGDALTAGLAGSTVSSYGAKMQMTALRSKVFSLPDETIVLPGHGPPSTVEAERRFNTGNMRVLK